MPHPCYKKNVVCYIVDRHGNTLARGSNVCETSAAPGVCARADLRDGECYDLCGPPIHAEAAAVDQFLSVYGRENLKEWRSTLTARIGGNDYVCRDCHRALASVGIRKIEMLPLSEGRSTLDGKH
jgi:hypothetical protein